MQNDNNKKKTCTNARLLQQNFKGHLKMGFRAFVARFPTGPKYLPESVCPTADSPDASTGGQQVQETPAGVRGVSQDLLCSTPLEFGLDEATYCNT